MRQEATMIATLGGQPQVVTFALDALFDMGVPITKVVVICLANPDKIDARNRLELELNSYYEGKIKKIEFRMVRLGSRNLKDIITDDEVGATSTFINGLVDLERRQARMLHVVVSGGRRILSLLTMATAMLSFQHPDRLWHMFNHDELQEDAMDGRLMHLPADITEGRFRMIEVPVLPLGHYFASLRNLEGIVGQRRVLDEVEYSKCQNVIEELAPRELDTLEAFARGLTRQQVADELAVSIKTVDQYKTKIYELCEGTWEFRGNSRVTLTFLATKFRDFFNEG